MSPTLIAALAGLTVALFVIGAFRGNSDSLIDRTRRRLSVLGEIDESVDPLERSFAQRAMLPILSVALRASRAVMPSQIINYTEDTLQIAGQPVTLNRFLTLWFLAGVCLPLAVGLAAVAAFGGLGGGPIIVVLMSFGLGAYVPWMWLRRQAGARMKATERDLPDAIDLIITNIEAGLGMQAALLTVSEKFSGPVGEAFGRVVRELSVGADRSEALANMARRSGVPGMRLFARAVAQAEQTGIPVARVLRNHSSEMRKKRQQLAREQAAKIPVKITIPTVLFMFPTVFVLILGPVVLDLLDSWGR